MNTTERAWRCICVYLSQSSRACDHNGVSLTAVTAGLTCVYLCVSCVCDLPQGVHVSKGAKNHGCTQSHTPSLSLTLSLNLNPSSLLFLVLPPLVIPSLCTYSDMHQERKHDCHVPSRSTLFELLLISCSLYSIVALLLVPLRQACTHLKDTLAAHKPCQATVQACTLLTIKQFYRVA